MGNTFEVSVWANVEGKEYKYITSYAGESFFSAVWDMYKCKKRYSFVKFEWRK